MKNILIKLDLNGRGIVNRDSNDQKYVLGKTHLKSHNNNVSFGKKCFIKNQDPENKSDVDYKLKISDDCLLKNAFRFDKIALVPNIAHHPQLLYSYIASPTSLITGYMYPSNKETLKRKGSLKLSDAIQTCDAKSVLEVFSRTGEKMKKDVVNDINDTTFFFKETVGDIEYSVLGNIDLMSLQFIPCDDMFDRYQFNPDHFELYKNNLKTRLPNFDSELEYYQLRNSSILIPERGILLSEENVIFLVKETLKRLLLIDIRRKGAFAQTSSLKIKLVDNPLLNKYDNEDGWITLENENDIENLDFDVHYFYELVNLDDAKKMRNDFDEKIKKGKDKAVIAKKEKQSNKEVKKENK